jgi:hypothetical protein
MIKDCDMKAFTGSSMLFYDHKIDVILHLSAILSPDIHWTGLMVVTVVLNIVAKIGIPPLQGIEIWICSA